ncbi:superoxide dismutase family protein [Chengkuizengella sediminis]|uniref:superoxide dismutase family protein n=1 Tax=Chengkuizengella sediminis TaxID=1885917 RepID=UPI00138A6723|nr:superoxide dismutase family protein [Chengkuizengella sediminis]NDI36297.1 superoxide dismutase family protein [Chengkuizengella sediminis]
MSLLFKRSIFVLTGILIIIIFTIWYIYEYKILSVNNLNETETLTIEFFNKEGEDIGNAHLIEDRGGVRLQLNFHDLAPGQHGFHVHEIGECKKPDFKSAGGHFNPTEKQHGFENPLGYHLGDLENIIADQDGKVNTEVELRNVTLKGEGAHSLLDHDGSSIVIHQHMDDYISDPSGNSGSRIGCGVIND